MKNIFTTKRICRAGVIAALYVALTYAFGALSYQGFLQIRPAEALCILPLFYVEAIPALYLGCMLSNLASPFLVYDVFVGSLATLVAAIGTWAIGKLLREEAKSFAVHIGRVGLGGLFHSHSCKCHRIIAGPLRRRCGGLLRAPVGKTAQPETPLLCCPAHFVSRTDFFFFGS